VRHLAVHGGIAAHPVAAHDRDHPRTPITVEQLGDGVVDGMVVDALGQLVHDVIAPERCSVPTVDAGVEGGGQGLGMAGFVLCEELPWAIQRAPEGPERQPVERREDEHPFGLEPPERFGRQGATHEHRSRDVDGGQRLGELAQVEALDRAAREIPGQRQAGTDLVEVVELGQRR
jgi:hypothetical protein